MSKPPPGRGHAHKHAGSRHKHQHTRKHHPVHQRGGPGPSGPGPPAVKQHHPHHAKARKLSPGSDVACCTAQAVGTLLGWGWDEVLALYWRTVSDPDSGASILATLQAARLAEGPGFYPSRRHGVARPFHDPLLIDTAGASSGLILGVELPGSHAIAVTPDGTWWSWGEPFNPAEWPDLTIEEAWAVPLC